MDERVTMRRMSRPSRSKLSPRLQRPLESVVSIRLDDALRAAMERKRGSMELSAWIREALRRAVESPDDQAVREVVEYMARRGVTIDMLKR